MPILKRTLTEDGHAEFIDVWEAITEFRRLEALRDAQSTDIARADYQGMMDQVRAEWAAYHCSDDLQELATGPDEVC